MRNLDLQTEPQAEVALADMYASRQIARHKKAGSSPDYHSRQRIGRSISSDDYTNCNSELTYQ